MVDRIVDLVLTDPTGCYLDLTAGGGGHGEAIATRLVGRGRLIALDKDSHAVERVATRLARFGERVSVVQASFSRVAEIAEREQITQVTGILLDLGLSSDQLDTPERGFAFRDEGPLDMRFDLSQDVTAAQVINGYDRHRLIEILRDFGEVPRAMSLVDAFIAARPVTTTAHVVGIVRQSTPPRQQQKRLAQVFQALRIAVNDEMGELDRVLPAATDLLGIGGRLAVLAYHSLEDRRVKQFIKRGGWPEGTVDQPARLLALTKKPMVAEAVEVAHNPRARSAKLRVAERIA